MRSARLIIFILCSVCLFESGRTTPDMTSPEMPQVRLAVVLG